MPVGEAIGEMILRPIFEIVCYGLFYWTGFVVLKIVTMGTIRLAPFSTIQEKNRSKKKWYQIDWSVWLHRPMQGRALKAECTCLVGILVWVGIGFGIYLGTRENQQGESTLRSDLPRVEMAMLIQPLLTHSRSCALE